MKGTEIVDLSWRDNTSYSTEDREYIFNKFINSDAASTIEEMLLNDIRYNCATIENVCLMYGEAIKEYRFNYTLETFEEEPGHSYDIYTLYIHDYERTSNQWMPLSTNYGIISDVSNAETNYSFYSPNGSAIWKNGGCVSWSPNYRGFAYSYAIKLYLDKTNYFVFTRADSTGSGVWLPNKDDLTNIGAINKIFEITILVTVTLNKVYIISEGDLLDNNDNQIKQSTFISAGGKRYNNYIEMTKGDILTLLFDGQKWHKKVHSS